jgi:hypothetical protein
MRLRHHLFIVVVLTGYAAVSAAQVAPARPVHPTSPGAPSGAHSPDSGDGAGGDGGNGACVFVVLLFSIPIGLGFVIVRSIRWLNHRRVERERTRRIREKDNQERQREERIEAENRLWNSIEDVVQTLLIKHYPMYSIAAIDRIKRELRYLRWDITSALTRSGPFRAESVTVLLSRLSQPMERERFELIYGGRPVSIIEVPDVELTMWHVRRRSGRQEGPVTVAQLRNIVRDSKRGMRIDVIRMARDAKWTYWANAGREYPELILAGVIEKAK